MPVGEMLVERPHSHDWLTLIDLQKLAGMHFLCFAAIADDAKKPSPHSSTQPASQNYTPDHMRPHSPHSRPHSGVAPSPLIALQTSSRRSSDSAVSPRHAPPPSIPPLDTSFDGSSMTIGRSFRSRGSCTPASPLQPAFAHVLCPIARISLAPCHRCDGGDSPIA